MLWFQYFNGSRYFGNSYWLLQSKKSFSVVSILYIVTSTDIRLNENVELVKRKIKITVNRSQQCSSTFDFKTKCFTLTMNEASSVAGLK